MNTKKKLIAIVITTATICCGLVYSQKGIEAKAIFRYLASLYVPSGDNANSNSSMLFGQEHLHLNQLEKPTTETYKRTYLR